MSTVDINQLLHQMRHMAAQADKKPSTVLEGSATGPAFDNILKDSIDSVNELQQGANDMATKFEAGDPSVNLTEVMVELQKASVSFEAMKQVRNKLLNAYKDVMSMQV
ncbi:MAG TPA: flagellar hook-basal body complex protein FliE [Chromatiaceae bacterium]|nr:flagellar hook-basal body complex protein FliE [Chromatiaceae bacterium]